MIGWMSLMLFSRTTSAAPPASRIRASSRSCNAVVVPLPALHSIARNMPLQHAMMSGMPARPKPLAGGKKKYTLLLLSTAATASFTFRSGVDATFMSSENLLYPQDWTMSRTFLIRGNTYVNKTTSRRIVQGKKRPAEAGQVMYCVLSH